MSETVYWHIPGFVMFRNLNYILIRLMKEFPQKFRDGYKIGSAYGSFPGAIWNGGRTVLGSVQKSDMEKIIAIYNSEKIPVRYTWTNTLLEEKHVYDTYCNLMMKMADNGLNQYLVNSSVLEEYLRREYPNFKVLSSTTKRIVGLDGIKAELEKDYFLVVLDYDLNHDEVVLKELEPEAGRIEILVNEVCFPNCPKRSAHYESESRHQLEFESAGAFDCPNQSTPRQFSECMKRPAFISNDEIGSYIDRGYVNFKIVGRGLPESYLKESYLYFLVRDEYRDDIRKRIDINLEHMKNPAPVRRMK